MKWFIGLAILSIIVQGAPNAPDDSKRSFSLFSVVTFKNEECTTQMATDDDPMKGICNTAEECSTNSGIASGNCASGFGVCCFYKADECDTNVEIKNNVTHIQNEDFPSAFPVATPAAAKTCTFKVKAASDVCQMRLDFEKGVFAQPTAAGVCTDDTVKVTSPSGINPPTICGTVTGSHMYVETARAEEAGTIALMIGATTFARMWKIKVTFLDCDNPNKAPSDCLQYFTQTSGRFFSFNKENDMIQSQNYNVCVKPKAGFCQMQVSETNPGGTPDTFQLDDSTTDAEVGVAECTQSWLEIDNKRHCGAVLNAVDSETASGAVIDTKAPFTVGVQANANAAIGTSFDVTYRLIPC